MKTKPHYLYMLVTTLKYLAALLIFYVIAIIFSPDRYYTALGTLKVLIPVAIIIYAYLFYFWHGVSIEIDSEKIIFTMTVGRKNHVKIPLNDISSVELKEPFLCKLFNLKQISIRSNSMEYKTGSDIFVVEKFLIFSSADAENIVSLISNK